MPIIEQIFFIPPMAIARLGGSDNPLDSFDWIEDPSLHGAGQTVIAPAISLEEQQDGSVRPFLPSTIQFRDGKLLRPVAPFLELWAKVKGSDEPQPLTTALLAENSATLHGLTFTVRAANLKAARRTGDPACGYQAQITVAGDDHARHPLPASSIGSRPLVADSRPIPVGAFRVIRPAAGSEMNVNLDTVRIRFTPARGLVYGPPTALRATDPETGRAFELVPLENRILNTDSAWITYDGGDQFDSPEPADTYDGADDDRRGNVSFGVVDDTCDVVIDAAVVLNGRDRFAAQARVFCGPPDFAPDRRPFVSLAEELTDRDPTPESQETLQELLARVGDLFQRVWETASLANVDAMRDRALSGQTASRFPPATTLKDSMTPADPLFDKSENLNAPPTTHERLPYASVAQAVHSPLADIEDLALFLHGNAEKVKRIIRPPFGSFAELSATVDAGAAPNPAHRDPRNDRDNEFDMRMPPYMRDADASPLSITRTQYALIMKLVDQLRASAAVAGAHGTATSPQPLRTAVRDHVERVARRRTKQ